MVTETWQWKSLLNRSSSKWIRLPRIQNLLIIHHLRKATEIYATGRVTTHLWTYHHVLLADCLADTKMSGLHQTKWRYEEAFPELLKSGIETFYVVLYLYCIPYVYVVMCHADHGKLFTYMDNWPQELAYHLWHMLYLKLKLTFPHQPPTPQVETSKNLPQLDPTKWRVGWNFSWFHSESFPSKPISAAKFFSSVL